MAAEWKIISPYGDLHYIRGEDGLRKLSKLAKLPFNDKLGLKIVPFEDTMFMILAVYFGVILTCFLVVILWAIVKDFLDPANSPLDPRKRWAHWPGSKINPGSDQGTPMRYGKKVYVEKTD